MIDWSWKLREALERIRCDYPNIGRKTGAPFLAVVYPPEAESAVLREWRGLSGTLQPDFEVRSVDLLTVTMAVVVRLGAQNIDIVSAIEDPMPGADPEAELGRMWVTAAVSAVREASRAPASGKLVVSLERLAALYPAAGPRAVMQAIWESGQSPLDGPVVVLVPGTLKDARTYSFLNRRDEFMYRGEIL